MGKRQERMRQEKSYAEQANLSKLQQKTLQKLSAGICCALALGFWGTGIVSAAEQTAPEQPAEQSKAASAEELNTFSLEGITVEAKRPDWESKLSPGSVTIIRPDDYKGEQKDLPDLLKMVPGVHVRELNGKGQYTTVSVRGSTAAQVGVFVDGVLFNLGGDAAADISTIPVQNVERIEVYRGYIPARFGGTFMGGVINIVTKKPTKANVQASVGQSSYGGYKANIQIDAPLGQGALMVAVNREQSEGDFRYTNRNNDARYQAELKSLNESIYGDPNAASIGGRLGILYINESIKKYTKGGPSGVQENYLTFDRCMDILKSDPETRNQKLLALKEELRPYLSNAAAKKWDSYFNSGVAFDFNWIVNQEEVIKTYESSDRWRKANDYKNTDAIIKWQDDHWLAKATWKKIKRHLPFPYNNNYASLAGIDTDGPYDNATLVDRPDGYLITNYFNSPLNIYAHRNQELTAKELLLGRRDTVGNLEWGWSVNYLNQNKDYYIDDWQWVEKNSGSMLNSYAANSLWSKYDSRKLGAKIDGTYKAGDAHLIEFLLDASKEKMDIDGWRMHDFANSSEDTRSRWRNYYEQEIFNAQVQDTITLNKKGDLWLTPSIRYNRSKILGRSDRYDEKNDPQHINWLGQTDEQIDDKVTWQLALKKQFNDHFTLRATGGTYYRLLNMYEIAGDGAGILPMPNGRGVAVFPQPEEGSQWDLSAIWDGKALGADTAKFQVTYFGRDSKRLLQLSSWNGFFFVYHNAASGKVNGLELQTDLSWKKWDVNLQGTYTQPTGMTYDMRRIPGAPSWVNGGLFSGVMTYQPKWEGTARFTYRPDKQWSLFTQCRYVGEMSTSIYEDASKGMQSSLTTWDLGVKYKINKSFQLAVGVTDVFDAADKMYQKNMFYTSAIARNIQYPLQGRTYYATMQYSF